MTTPFQDIRILTFKDIQEFDLGKLYETRGAIRYLTEAERKECETQIIFVKILIENHELKRQLKHDQQEKAGQAKFGQYKLQQQQYEAGDDRLHYIKQELKHQNLEWEPSRNVKHEWQFDKGQRKKQLEKDIRQNQLLEDIVKDLKLTIVNQLKQFKTTAVLTEQKFTNLAININTIYQNFKTIDQKINTIEQKIDTISKKTDTIDKKIDTIDKKINTIDKNIDTIDQNIDNTIDLKAADIVSTQKCWWCWYCNQDRLINFLVIALGAVTYILSKHDEQNKVALSANQQNNDTNTVQQYKVLQKQNLFNLTLLWSIVIVGLLITIAFM